MKNRIQIISPYLNKLNFILLLSTISIIYNIILNNKLKKIDNDIEQTLYFSIESADNSFEAKKSAESAELTSEQALEYSKEAASNSEEAVWNTSNIRNY